MTATPSTTLDTYLQHAGSGSFDPASGAGPVSLPAVRTSTVRFQDLASLERAQAGKARGERVATYGRVGLDTHAALEQVFCQLEGGQRACLAPSGLAAISLALLALTRQGDHVLATDSVYGPVRYLHRQVLSRYGVGMDFCAGTTEALAGALRPTTRVLYTESPGSLLFEMLDLPALAAFARDHGLVLVVDNTWGSGYIYQPLRLGAHVSVVAGTKYVGGHSDLMLGAVVANDEALVSAITDTHYALGLTVSADDAWLALRGVRTLPLRMQQAASNALAVCEYLASRAEVTRIFHPAWPDDPGHALWRRDCTGSNGMLSVALTLDGAAARRLVDALRLFGIGFSWGGFESLVQWVEPEALSGHHYWGNEGGSVLRLHIGLESPDDLIADLAQAFAAAGG